MSVLEKLTEGIVNRDLQKEGAALLGKWEKTGLLEGITNKPIDWYVVDRSYGWHLDPLNVWTDNSVTFRISKGQFLENLNKGKENRAFLIKKSLS